MKIVNLETFRAMPENTLFSKYEPCAFGELQIKYKTIELDFFATDGLSSCVDAVSTDDFMTKLEDARNNGTAVELDFDTISRDGMFEEGQLFAVWEKADVEQLIERLKLCL